MKKFNLLISVLLCSVFMYAGNTNPAPAASSSNSKNMLVNELNTSAEAQSYPWISNDALRVYYTHDKDIYMASRKTIQDKFEAGKAILKDDNITVISGWLTPDELTIYFTNQASDLFKSTRQNMNESFIVFTEIKLTDAPKGSLFDASFTPDMEELLFYNNDKKECIVKFIKKSDNEYQYIGAVTLLSDEIPTGGQLSRDGLHFYLPFKSTTSNEDDYRHLYMLSRNSMHDEFTKIEKIKTANPINFTAYQPTVNADGTQLFFVTGSQNLWDNNDLCSATLVKDQNEIKPEVLAFDPAKEIPSEAKQEIVSPVNPNPVNDNVTATNKAKNELKIDMRVAPNPFNESTNIEINAPEGGHLVVQAFSMDGQLVAELYSGECEKGINIVKWIKNGLTNGIFTVKAVLGNNVVTKKVVTCSDTH